MRIQRIYEIILLYRDYEKKLKKFQYPLVGDILDSRLFNQAMEVCYEKSRDNIINSYVQVKNAGAFYF